MNTRDAWLRFRALFLPRRVESELDEELAAHIEMQARKHTQAGMSAQDARRRARLDFGGLDKVKEECRDARQITWLSHLIQDLGYAVRAARREPGFTGVVVVMLALAMGATLAIFSVTDAILLRMLPVKDPASLFRMVGTNGDAYGMGGGGSYKLYLQMQKRTTAFAELIAYQPAEPSIISIAQDEASRLVKQMVSGNYFDVLGIQPAAGRLISPEDERQPGQGAVAVISYRLWESRFDTSERAIGTKIRIYDHVFDIVGVAPKSFFGVEVGKMVDVWTPISLAPAENLNNDHNFWLRIMGRVRPGISIARAAAPMEAVMNETMLEDVRQHAPPGTPKEVIDRFLKGMQITGVPAAGGISSLRSQYRLPLQVIMLVVGLVLLIACSSVANLLIARGSARRHEIAIRLSLGAAKGRILQQLVTESSLLALTSAGVGLAFAHWGAPFLVRLLTPISESAKLATGIDIRLLAFMFVLSLLTVLICGLIPATQLARTDMHTTLKGGTRFTSGSTGRVRKILVASQVAFSTVLIIAAILFTRTLVNLVSTNLGFNPRGVLVTRIALQGPGSETRFAPVWSEFLRRVRTLPGVEQASLSSGALFSGEPSFMGIRTASGSVVPTDPLTGTLFVSNGYFQTLGIGFLAGRDFRPGDNDDRAPRCAIVNQSFVRKFLAIRNPLGSRLTKLANAPVWTEIVGIVKDTKYGSLRENPPPMLYVPYGRMAEWISPQGHPGDSLFLEVLGHEGRASFAVDLRREAGQRFTIGEMYRQQMLIDDTLVRERLLATLANLFAGLALGLAMVGIYGIVSYAVIRRRQELGVRMALGAGSTAIVGLMLREWARIVGAGTIIGMLAAAFSSRLARALLFGLAPGDAATFLAACVLLLAASIMAAFLPAYRAVKTDPVITLRQE